MSRHHSTRMLPAVLLGLVGHVAASKCLAGNGLCKELEDETPTSIGLLQIHADKAQPLHPAVQTREIAERHQDESTIEAAANGSQPLPAAIGNLLPPAFNDFITDIAAQGFISVFNSSLVAVETRADAFLEMCQKYKTDIVTNISGSVETASSEWICGQFQAMADSRLGDTYGAWSGIASLFQAMGQPVIGGLQALGLSSAAGSVNRTYSSLMTGATRVSALLVEARGTIKNFTNDTEEVRDLALQDFDSIMDEGMTTVTAFKKDLVEMVKDLFDGVSAQASKQVNITIEPLQGRAAALAGKLGDSLDDILSGTRKAAHVAVNSATVGLRAWLGLALVAVSVFVSPAPRQ